MKTIAKNRVAAFLPRITEAKSYTLDNYFIGEPIKDLARWRDWAARSIDDGKVQVDDAAKQGRIRYHSNHWVEFRYV